MTDATKCWGWDDAGIDVLISRRAAQFSGPDPDEYDPSWQDSVRKFNERAQAERRSAWCEYHRGLARIHLQLADEHERKAAQLSGVTGNGGEGSNHR